MKNRRVLIALLSCVVVGGVSTWSAGWFSPTETTIHKLAPGVYFRKVLNEPEFIGCNQGWVIFKDFVLVIDANFPNQAEVIIKEIRKIFFLYSNVASFTHSSDKLQKLTFR